MLFLILPIQPVLCWEIVYAGRNSFSSVCSCFSSVNSEHLKKTMSTLIASSSSASYFDRSVGVCIVSFDFTLVPFPFKMPLELLNIIIMMKYRLPWQRFYRQAGSLPSPMWSGAFNLAGISLHLAWNNIRNVNICCFSRNASFSETSLNCTVVLGAL